MSAALRVTLTAALLSLCGLAGGLLSAPASMAATPPAIEEASVLEASATSATLQATINPEGSETTYRFEYGTSEAYGSSAPVPDGLLGSGTSPIVVTAHIQGLSGSAAYHYRVVATVPSREETVDGADGTFTTQPLGGSFALPDGRQWELVSPPNKHGSPIRPINERGLIQAAENGSAITYVAAAPTELEPKGYGNAVQVFSQRGGAGWSSKDLSPPHNEITGVSVGAAYEYHLFSPDLSLGAFAQEAYEGPPTQLTPAETIRTPDLRHNFSCEGASEACYTPLVTASNVPPGTESGGGIVGGSPDLKHIVLGSATALTSTPGDEGGLYEWSEGHLQLISILPEAEGGKPTNPNEGVGLGFGGRAANAVSNDGSRVFWFRQAANQLYVRDTVRQETLRIGSEGAEFQTASSDGSRVFYTELHGGAESLEVCEIVVVAGKLACKTTQLAPDVQVNVLGASEDGSWIYFVSDSALAPGAVPGECYSFFSVTDPPSVMCNLYAAHYNGTAWEAPKLVAVLSAADFGDWGADGVDLGHVTARVSPNGRWLAFMSERSLTGYDDRDAVSGKPDEEVYLYNSEVEKLVCASCNPTGARPVGSEYGRFGKLVGGDRVWSNNSWLASNIPGWTPYELGQALYQSRYLSNGGRLFFNSRDALVPQDVNGEWDVYEFEPAGVGGCSSAGTTFDAVKGGCVGLISSGTSPEESAFVDASEDGDDVFFLTASKLAPEDVDAANDMYDAHVCGSGWPCLAYPTVPPPCSTGDSCKAAPTPQPAIFGAPASSTFSGVGDLSASLKSAAAPRSLSRSQKLARALKACRGKPRKKRRSCEKAARRRFAAKQSRNARTSGGGHR